MIGLIVVDMFDLKRMVKKQVAKEWELDESQIRVELVCTECERNSRPFENYAETIVARVKRQW